MLIKSKENLRGKLASKKISQRKLAECIGVHPSFINHLTSGRQTKCTPFVAERIAAVLEIPVGELFSAQEPSKTRRTPASQAEAQK